MPTSAHDDLSARDARSDAARLAAERGRPLPAPGPAAAPASPISAFWITDVGFRRLVYVSPGFEKLWGRTCASFQAEPRSILDAVHPLDRERVAGQYERQKQGVMLDQEYRIVRPDGTVRWIWDRRSPMGDASEQVYAGVAIDITDRKQAEQLLLRHDLVVQSSSEAIISTTLEGVITAWNPAAETLFGYSAGQAIGASVMIIVPAGRADEEANVLGRIERGETIGTVETQRQRRDGALLDVALTISPLRETDGRVVGAAIICRDIGPANAARAALRESERCFHDTFELLPIGIAHVALDGRLVRVNQRLSALTGYPRDALLQQTLAGMADADDRTIDGTQMLDLLSGKIETYTVEKRLTRRYDFPIWVECTVTAVRRADGELDYLLAAMYDITPRRDLCAQLRQAQKMEAIGQLASGVAHDFNNVLGYVTMRAELTCTYPDLPANVMADLQQIKAAANRATHLTRQLLAFSRNEQTTRPQRVDVNELITGTIKMVQRLLGEDLTLDIALHRSPIMLHLDPGVIDQILLNLAVNARDAMPEGGTLTIETTEFVVPDRESRPALEIAPGRYACIRVSDTGMGIPPENMSRIFEPFFTTKEPGRGTGLGLTMVATLVKQNRGWINVESEPTAGTTFRVYLPALDPGAEGVIFDPPPSAPERGSETILLVEDESALRMTTRTLLQRQGYTVLEAASGVEAIGLWEQYRDQIALVFTDMILPDGVSGRVLATHVQADRPEAKIVFTTGYSPDVAGRELRLHDGVNFLPKPYTAERLFRVIRQSLNAKA